MNSFHFLFSVYASYKLQTNTFLSRNFCFCPVTILHFYLQLGINSISSQIKCRWNTETWPPLKDKSRPWHLEPVCREKIATILWWRVSILIGEGSSRKIMHHCMAQWAWQQGKWYVMTFLVTRSQLNNWEVLHWSVLDSTFHHHHRGNKWGNIVWKNGVYYESITPEICRIYIKAQ